MKILILGSNDVATALAQELCAAGHDITVIDNRPEAIKKIDLELDVRGIIGHPTYPEVLKQGECADSDVLIAVLAHDESNMVACQIAHSLFNVPIKIARIRTNNYLYDGKLFGDDNLPIDIFINPESILARKICHTINHPGAQEVQYHLESGIFRLILPESSDWSDKSVEEIESSIECKILAKITPKKIMYLAPSDILKANNEIIIASAISNINNIIEASGIENPHIDEIVIGGAGANARHLVRQLSSHFKITLIEKNYHTCQRFAGEFQNVTILKGDVKDELIWEQEELNDADIYCALTDDDASNVLSSLIAKELGCKKTLCLFREPNYLKLMKSHLDYGISAQMAMVNTILTALYKKHGVHLVFTLANGQLISASIVIHNNSSELGKPLKKASFGKGIHIAGICRNNTFIIDQDALLQEHDLVIVITNSRKMIHDLKNHNL